MDCESRGGKKKIACKEVEKAQDNVREVKGIKGKEWSSGSDKRNRRGGEKKLEEKKRRNKPVVQVVRAMGCVSRIRNKGSGVGEEGVKREFGTNEENRHEERKH